VEGPVAVLFLVLFIVGALLLLLTLAISHFIGGRDGDGPPFRLLAQGAGIVGASAGGLIGTWLNLDRLGVGIAIAICAAAVLVVIYRVALPYLHRRRDSSPDDPTSSSSRFPVRPVYPLDVGRILVTDDCTGLCPPKTRNTDCRR
jgi:hypothetical protein